MEHAASTSEGVIADGDTGSELGSDQGTGTVNLWITRGEARVTGGHYSGRLVAWVR